MSRNRRRQSGSDSLLAMVLIAVIAMPLFGVYLLTRNNETDRRWGAALTISGIAIWILIGLAGA